MGFRLNRTYLLKFEDSALEGAEIRFRATPISVMIQLGERLQHADLAGLVAEYVIDWNWEDEKGEPLPVTAEAILENWEEPVLARVCQEWYKAAKGVTAPLEKPSTDGTPSQEQNLPMEPLSDSPPS